MNGKQLTRILPDASLSEQCFQRRGHDAFKRELAVRHDGERFCRIDEAIVQKYAIPLNPFGLHFDPVGRDNRRFELSVFTTHDSIIALINQVVRKGGNGIGRVETHPTERLKVTRFSNHRDFRGRRLTSLTIQSGQVQTYAFVFFLGLAVLMLLAWYYPSFSSLVH